METKTPDLFVDLAKMTNILSDGSEQSSGFSVRISLRYERSVLLVDSNYDEFYDIPVRITKEGIFPNLESSDPVEIMRYVISTCSDGKDRLLKTLEFSEQNMKGVTIRGKFYEWVELIAAGYKALSNQVFAQKIGA